MNIRKVSSVIYIIGFIFIAILESSLPFIGLEKGISLVLLLYLIFLQFNVFSLYRYYFLIGLIADIISFTTPFGFYSFILLFLAGLYFLLFRNLPKFLLGMIFYVVTFLILSIFITGFNFSIFITAIFFYLICGTLVYFIKNS